MALLTKVLYHHVVISTHTTPKEKQKSFVACVSTQEGKD